MYKVVLIEDEQWTLRGIKKTFEWEKYEFEVVGEAMDGNEGYSLILKHNPDVVFTDIRMPGLLGTELIKKARKNNINSKFIIITAYADFTYAQNAISNGVFEYLLKPINSEIAAALLGRLKKKIDQEKGINDDAEVEIIKNANFKKMIDYINENYEQKLYLNELAKQFDCNSNYCCGLFKKIFNLSFSEYVLKTRMKEAARLLTKTDTSITDIALKIGYDDYYYFNRMFKKFYNIPPRQYRIKNS
ncbi:MAG: response regulator [Oscillospiraceae bacterium]